MANDQKISGMTAATTPLTGTESVELVQGGVNKQATVQDIADLANPPTTPDLATVLTNGNDASGISIIGLPSPTVGSEATNKNYVDSAVGSVGTPPLGSVVAQGNDTSGFIITGLPTPTTNTDAANKQYVDGVASGSSHLADYTTINDAAPLAANCNSLKEPKFYTEIANNRTIDFTNVRAVNNANQYCTVFWVFKKTVAGDIVITLDADSSQFTNKDLASDTAVTSYTLTGASNSYFKLTAVFHGESSGSIVWWNLVTTLAGGGGGTWGSITGTLSSQTDLQAALDAKLALAGGTMSGAIAMGNQKITGLGAATTNGDALRYQQLIGVQDLFIPASAMWPRVTNGCQGLQRIEMTTSLFNIQALAFDTTTQEFAQFQIVMPRKYNNSTITFVPYWTAQSGTGTVQWGVSGGAYSDDDALTVAFGTAQTSDDTLITANDLHVGPASSAITLAGTPADADFLAFQISRNPASDTLTTDALLLGISIRITTDAGVDA